MESSGEEGSDPSVTRDDYSKDSDEIRSDDSFQENKVAVDDESYDDNDDYSEDSDGGGSDDICAKISSVSVEKETEVQPSEKANEASVSYASNEKDKKPEIKTPKKVKEQDACYLVYDSSSTGRLMNYYSKAPVDRAVGAWVPAEGKKFPKYKFKLNFGRTELIRHCAAGLQGRKNYMSGWCQFIRNARLQDGVVTKFEIEEGDIALEVDVYGFMKNGNRIVHLENNNPVDISVWDAVAAIPHQSDIFVDMGFFDQLRFLVVTQQIGFSSAMD